jgi:hypothetical protein
MIGPFPAPLRSILSLLPLFLVAPALFAGEELSRFPPKMLFSGTAPGLSAALPPDAGALRLERIGPESSPAPASEPAAGPLAFLIDSRILEPLPPGSSPEEELLRSLAARLETARPSFVLIGISPSEGVERAAYLVKRLSSLARGAAPSSRIALDLPEPAITDLASLASHSVSSYVDLLVVRAAPPSPDTEARLLEQGWPTGRIERAAPDADPLESWLDGATRRAEAVIVDCTAASGGCRAGASEIETTTRMAKLLAPLSPATGMERILLLGTGPNPSRTERLLPPFLEPDTLATIVFLPPGPAGARIALAEPAGRKVELVDLSDGRRTIVRPARDGSILVAAAPAWRPLRLSRPDPTLPTAAEAVFATAANPDPTAAEIIARHRARRSAIERGRTSLAARARTSLRFRVGATGPSFEIDIRGPYFWRGDDDVEWVWEEFRMDGVLWRGDRPPEIPLLQPEKVATPPLALSLTEDYVYELLGRGEVGGRSAWQLRFVPESAAAGKSLWRGRAWIDAETFDLLRTEAIQTNPGGEVLSNEEIVEMLPGPDGFPLPSRISGQSSLSVAGQVTSIERLVALESIRINPPSFEEERDAARASRKVMVRETDAGIRYFDPVPGGAPAERKIRDEIRRSQLFGLLGVFSDDSTDYPLPLAGVNYLDFDLFGSGLQTNVFFAGALVTANLTNPRLFGSRFDFGADLFATAFRSNDDVWANGDVDKSQRIGARPAALQMSIGHPLGEFWKVSLRGSASWTSFARDDETADDFTVPRSGLTTGLALELRWDRLGWSVSAEGAESHRHDWEFWGRPDGSDWAESPSTYRTWKLAAGREWRFAGYQRFRVEASWLDGSDLDRFSRYSFGFFGGAKVSGFAGGKVRTEEAAIASATWGLAVAELFRLDFGIDSAWATDRAAGWDRTRFTGVSLSGNTVGPWNTLVRYSVGVPVEGPESNGFVLFVAFLKLF